MFKKIVGAIVLAGCIAFVAPQVASADTGGGETVVRCFGNVCYEYDFDSNGNVIEIRRTLLVN